MHANYITNRRNQEQTSGINIKLIDPKFKDVYFKLNRILMLLK